MERYEGGIRMSEKQGDAMGEAACMITFVKNALEEAEIDAVIDGLLPIIKEIEKRLDFACLEDPEEFQARIAAEAA